MTESGQGLLAAQQVLDCADEVGTRDDAASSALLGDPIDPRLHIIQSQVPDPQVDDFSRSHPGQAQADQDLVTQAEIGAVPAGARQSMEGLLMAEPPGRGDSWTFP